VEDVNEEDYKDNVMKGL